MSTRLPVLAVLFLLSALLAAGAAHGAPTEVIDGDDFAFEETAFEESVEDVGEEVEVVEAECEAAEEELEEGELGEAAVERICEEEVGTSATDSVSSDCPVRSAHAHAVEKNDRLKMTIGYTTNEPTRATLEIRAGSTQVASLKRHLGRSGVLRFTKVLSKMQAGKRTLVRIKLPKGSAGCPSRRLVLFPR